MARARYIKPGFFTNERVGELDPLDRILWQGLWCHADREGRLKDNPRRLKVEVMPWDGIDVDAALGRLQDAGFVRRYSVNGEHYLVLPSFVEHQHPHPKEPASVLPPPEPEPVPELPERAAKATGMHSERAAKALLTESGSSGSSESESGLPGETGTQPADKPPRRRTISENDLVTLEAEYPDVDVRAVMADYLNWSGSSKHVDKVQGLRNQLRDPRKRDIFRKAPAAPPSAPVFVGEPKVVEFGATGVMDRIYAAKAAKAAEGGTQ